MDNKTSQDRDKPGNEDPSTSEGDASKRARPSNDTSSCHSISSEEDENRSSPPHSKRRKKTERSSSPQPSGSQTQTSAMNSTNDSDMMHFTIKTLDSRDHPFDLDNNITVLQLKHEIHARMGINVNMQRLIFCGRVLQDEKKLADYNVAGKVVHLVERAPNSLRGPARPPSNPNPNVDPNETTFSIQEQEYLFSPNHSPTMTRILCLKTLLRTLRTSIKACKATDPDQDSSSSSEESDEEDAYGPYLQRARTHSRPADLADLSDQLHDLEEQFEPYREQYMLCLREANDPSITLSERTLQRRQRLSDRVRAVFHHLSHAYHLLSDINLLLSHNASRLTSEMLVENRPLSPIQAQVNVVSTNRSGHRGGTASAQHGHRSNSQFTNSGQAASNQGQARSSSQTTNSNARNLNQPTGWSRGQMNQDTSGNRATASDNTKTDTDEQAMNLDPAEGSGRATGGAPNKDEDPNVDRTAAHSAGSNQSTNTNNKDAKNQNQTTNSNPNANQNQNRGRNPNQPTVNIEVHDPITVQVQIETRVPIPLQPMMGNMDQRGQNAARNPNQDARANQQGNQDFQFNGLGAGEIGGFEVVVNMDDASGGATGGTNISGGTMPRRNLTADQILDDGNIYVAHMNGAQSSAEVIQQVMGSIIRQGLVPGVTSDAHVMHVYVPNMGQNSGSTSANPTNDQTEDQPNRNQNQNENENQNQSENQSQNPSENPTQNQNQNQNETGNQQDQAQRQSHWSSRVHRQRFATRANHNMFRRLHNSYARHYTVPLENVIYDRFLQCTSFMGREAARLSHHTRSHEPGLVYRPECTMGQIQNNVEMLYNHYTRNPLSPNRLLIALTILLRESSSFTTGRFLAPHELVPLRQPLSEYAHQVLGRDFNPADGDELIDGIFQRNAAFLRRVPEITPMRQNVDIIETMRGVLSRFISQVMYCVTIHSPEIFFDRFRLIFPRMFLELCGYMSYCCLEGTEGLRTIYRSFIIDVVSDVDETIRDLLMSVSMDNIFGFLNRVQNCRLRNIQFVRMLPGTGAEGEQTNEEARAQASGETSAQASAQASARASTQASEQRSAQTSTQAQRKAQTNTQTSAQTSAQASGEPSRQRNDSAAEARSRIPTESHAGRRRPHETIYDSEDDSPRVGLDNGMIDRNEPFVEHLFGQIRDRLRTFVNEEIDLTRGDDDEPMRIINVPPHVLSIPLPTGGFPSGVRIPPSASPRPPTSNGDANDAVPCISISSSSGDDSNSSTSSRLCQPSKSDHQPMSSSADSQSSVEENYVPPANIRQHWGEEWEPTFRRDRQAQSGAQAHAQPPSDAYMSGMPSKKRRCVRQSRPPTTLNGFIQESMGEVNVSMDGVAEDDRVRAMFNEHFRDLARSRAENSVDYSARRFPGVGIFLRGSSTTDPNAPLPDFSDSSEGL
ncbi:uncharacterized protein LOC119835625 isoform X5 [Zerene cesonia]|uniref:uncharacterized protein LOC119835625 isoform X5 n=1 Tax=Zerene cesonia TaxID=33412 RepID=UPI0018E4DF8B|nr:uncharacterized protein LOC119835625 isoform X5 [Zerene cesonia]